MAVRGLGGRPSRAEWVRGITPAHQARIRRALPVCLALFLHLTGHSADHHSSTSRIVTIQIAKAMHIIGFTCWFAGLFYLVRLYVYNCEARDRGNTDMAAALNIMQRRLFYGITCPVMVVTLLFGAWLMAQVTQSFTVVPSWFYLKLTLVSLLVGYTLWCGRLHKQLVTDTCSWTSGQLRVLNEVATVFLVFIVFIGVFQHMFSVKVALTIAAGLVCVMVPGFALFGRRSARRHDAFTTRPPSPAVHRAPEAAK